MRVLAKITAVQPSVEIVKRDGGTYMGARISYVAGGEERKKEIHEKVVDGNQELKAKILALEGQIGKDVCLVMQKNGKFTNLLDILAASEADKGSEDNFASNKSSGGGGFSGGFKRGGASPQDTARIARATAITAAASISKDRDDVIDLAEQFAAFILAPVSTDTMGVAVSLDTNVDVVEEVVASSDGGDSDAKLPF